MNNIGLYVHVPFCLSKCAYCDFYSFEADEKTYDRYETALLKHISAAGVRFNVKADTLYFGGGTPSLLGGKRIAEIVDAARKSFGFENSEVTVEVNPADNLEKDLKIIASCGVNRVSIGVQSAVSEELRLLSRRHCNDDVLYTVKSLKDVGLANFSVDIMLGIPHQTMKSLDKTLDFVTGLEPKHISCYMLKVEPDTPFAKADISLLGLPDEDTVCDMYYHTSFYLSAKGFKHYEISNFALPGFESKHNNKYWNCDEYLGFGPAAHSFIGGRRFYFGRDLESYISAPKETDDGTGGDSDEYIMLRLRLSEGVRFDEYERRFGKKLPERIVEKAIILAEHGLAMVTSENINLTLKGFILSNSCITELLS